MEPSTPEAGPRRATANAPALLEDAAKQIQRVQDFVTKFDERIKKFDDLYLLVGIRPERRAKKPNEQTEGITAIMKEQERALSQNEELGYDFLRRMSTEFDRHERNLRALLLTIGQASGANRIATQINETLVIIERVGAISKIVYCSTRNFPRSRLDPK